MDQNIEKYLSMIFEEKSLVVIEECIFSLNVSIELADISDAEKERMLLILELMLNHLKKIDTALKISVDHQE